MSDYITFNEFLDQLEKFRDEFGNNKIVTIDPHIGVYQGNRSPFIIKLKPQIGNFAEYITLAIPSIVNTQSQNEPVNTARQHSFSAARIYN